MRKRTLILVLVALGLCFALSANIVAQIGTETGNVLRNYILRRCPIAQRAYVTDSSDTRVCTSTDYGKVIILTHADTVAVTLPANGAAAGSQIDFMWDGNDSLAVTVSAATADTLVGPNDVDLDSFTYGAGHRIGAYARVMSDGDFWHLQNLSDCTMTTTD